MGDTHTQKFISWNVNGLRAVLKKEPSFQEIFESLDADIFAIQETKLQEGRVELDLPGYTQAWSYAARKGYSGTAVFSREEPIQVIREIGSPVAEDEGRVCALEFPKFWFVCVYTPNSKQGLARIGERMEWDRAYTDFLAKLAKDKPVVTCGDFNVAHEEIDLKNPDTNHENAGFSDQEREGFTKLLAAGFHDVFREANPTLEGAYTWWSYRMRARARGIGWRIDYFLVSDGAEDRVQDAKIHDEIMGSDHCPIELDIAL